MNDDILSTRLDGIQRSVDDGFSRMDGRLQSVEADVKALREEGLPRRVGVLEKWKDSQGAKLWALLLGVIVAGLSAGIGVIS